MENVKILFLIIFHNYILRCHKPQSGDASIIGAFIEHFLNGSKVLQYT